jgi:hypothetical protein
VMLCSRFSNGREWPDFRSGLPKRFGPTAKAHDASSSRKKARRHAGRTSSLDEGRDGARLKSMTPRWRARGHEEGFVPWVDTTTGISIAAKRLLAQLCSRRRSSEFRDSPDESQTSMNIRDFPALVQDRTEVLRENGASGAPNRSLGAAPPIFFKWAQCAHFKFDPFAATAV